MTKQEQILNYIKEEYKKNPEDYINKIICGDCLEVMKGIPDKAVDLVLTDPPYGIGIAMGINRITPVFNSATDLQLYIDASPIELMCSIALTITTVMSEGKKN